MAKIKYDVRGVESRDFSPPPPGLYRAKIEEVNEKTSSAGNEMLEVVLEISRGDHKGARLWDYVVLTEAAAWKLKQFLQAVGLVSGKKERGTLDTSKIVGTEVQVRVKNETDDSGEIRARVGAILAMPETEDDEDIDDEDDDIEDDDVEDDDDADEEDDDEDEEDDEEEESYEDWTVAELKTELKERGLKTAGSKRVLVKRLEKDDENDDGDEPF